MYDAQEHDVYRLIYSQADAIAQNTSAGISKVLLGLNWSLVTIEYAQSVAQVCLEGQGDVGINAQFNNGNETKAPRLTQSTGLCFSPPAPSRTFPLAGMLSDGSLTETLAALGGWDACKSAVALALANALINGNTEGGPTCLTEALSLANFVDKDCPPHLRVFHYFAPQLRTKKVAIIGHYPGLDEIQGLKCQLCLERNPQAGDLPDSAAEYVLPDMDWVFITASSIANKTLPRLLQLSADAKVVLMGPSLPWLAEWRNFGVDYLAGISIEDADKLWTVAAEAGGTRIFTQAVDYRLLAL
jgi:uncharacterized protein (DUF4213/DUF364 family)